MGFFSVFLIALALAMDALAVSITSGITIKNFRMKDAIVLAFFCGSFQFIMPLAGWFLGTTVSNYIEKYDHWIAFVLLSIIGGKMIASYFDKNGDESAERNNLSIFYAVTLAVATSIDALAVGVSFAFLKVNILYACSIIGVTAFVISFTGAVLGKRIGSVFKDNAELLGGIILVVIGIRILVSHLRG